MQFAQREGILFITKHRNTFKNKLIKKKSRHNDGSDKDYKK